VSGFVLALASSAALASGESGYLGRWDVTLQTPERELPSWIEVVERDGGIAVRMVGRWGHARWLPRAEIAGDRIRFVSPKEEEGSPHDLVFEGRLSGKTLRGQTLGPDGKTWPWRAERAPALERKSAPSWDSPVQLFDGKSLAGWHSSDPKGAKTWIVEDGAIVSLGRGPELVTDRKFEDFKLHIEFKVAEGANSGVYLRGRYEVQVENDLVPEAAADRALGGVYGFLAPAAPPPRKHGEWQSYDITLVGRRVTVVLDGETLIADQEIPGITGGALDSHEGLPGPLYLQGSENGRVAWRNIVITPAKSRDVGAP
jgi:hypothetical protein